MAGKNGYKTKQFIKAIPGSGGIITTIAKRVGCSWETAKKYITEYPTVTAVYNAERESIVDLCEGVIIRNIQLTAQAQKETGEKQDAGDAKWVISRLGKDRGYVERQEIQQTVIDLSKATNEQLERIANGEHPTTVMADTSSSAT